jgi:hypothetical protein
MARPEHATNQQAAKRDLTMEEAHNDATFCERRKRAELVSRDTAPSEKS